MSSLRKKAHSGSHINEYLLKHHALKHINDPVSEMWPKYSDCMDTISAWQHHNKFMSLAIKLLKEGLIHYKICPILYI